MHLLAARPGVAAAAGPIDLRQTPGDLVILAAQDSLLALLAETAESRPPATSLRLANLAYLEAPAAYDRYEDQVLRHAKVIVAALLGGTAYWQYLTGRLTALAENGIQVILVPGDDSPEPDLMEKSTLPAADQQRVWRYLREGGKANIEALYAFLQARCFNQPCDWPEPRTWAPCLLYRPGGAEQSLDEWRRLHADDPRPRAMLLLYRAHVQSGNTAAFDDFIRLIERRFALISLAVLSPKQPACAAQIALLQETLGLDLVFNTTGFAGLPAGEAVVLQGIPAATERRTWHRDPAGLGARDLAMHVMLPELDGRVIGPPISFKAISRRSALTQTDIVRYKLHRERARQLVELGWRWARLGKLANRRKRVAVVLANYPLRDGRIGNGVGLDTPASLLNLLQSMAGQGYDTGPLPDDSETLMQQLQAGSTNDLERLALKPVDQSINLADYRKYFARLPKICREAVIDRWGEPEDDPLCINAQLRVGGLALGRLFIGIQPARGYDLDLTATYHDPTLVPPHGYLAFYFYLRHDYRADAVVQLGKHGNLEWLPGKALGLSNTCWPWLLSGNLPLIYPFIVNDPGEGTQAKRRTQAVIIDHLTPPLARAELYGDLLELEQLIEEYYQARGLDPARAAYLEAQLLARLEAGHLQAELPDTADTDSLLGALDAYLCDLKEAQIRHGLHRFGQLPARAHLGETLVALTRLPRGEAEADRGLLHALVADLDLATPEQPFDPLDFAPGEDWRGPRPALLQDLSRRAWRNCADTRERLELLALQLIETRLDERPTPKLPAADALLEQTLKPLHQTLIDSAEAEIKHCLRALDGRFVPPGPAGAPSRGRLDVLPTGRNFYSLDARTLPTPAAWELGQRSAERLLERHLQEHGEYPPRLGLSVWGTATMRNGGEDIAQAFALLGVRPLRRPGSARVTGIEVLPCFQLGRPRVDVVLRVSGFFRDAFAEVMTLFDQAVRAVADFPDPGEDNPLRTAVNARREALMAAGCKPARARQLAGLRVFSSPPGVYGAGLQDLIDQSAWQTQGDLARAYVRRGGYGYGEQAFGVPAHAEFEHLIGGLHAVLHNQDNREHDVLDSDDYYQFQGGMAAAAREFGDTPPTVYHADHSNPANPHIRTLKEELNRVIRSRLVNPKWLAAARAHGYKGAAEMAASVDFLFAYDATTGLIDDYQYALVTDTLLGDAENRAFLQRCNPQALKDMAERLLEAQQRSLWRDAESHQAFLLDLLVDLDAHLEQRNEL